MTASSEVAMNEASTAPSDAQALRIHPPLLALVCFAAALALHLVMPEPHTVMVHHVVGLLLTTGGVGLAFYAAALFQASDTTKNPYGEPSKFVTPMPYTFTRNPMYLGLTTALIGLAVFFGSVVMLLAPLAFFLVIDRVVIPQEEQTMARKFGAEYLEYKSRVRRWL
jgi:protein-S-isoprenylcysteine O-methyltransferase Ste14